MVLFLSVESDAMTETGHLDSNAGVEMIPEAYKAYGEWMVTPNPSNLLTLKGSEAAKRFETSKHAYLSLFDLSASEDAERDAEREGWKVVFTSGASEGIVTLLTSLPSLLSYLRFTPGIPLLVVGDPHHVVMATAERYGIPLRSISRYEVDGYEGPSLGLFITHVVSNTGEILDLPRLAHAYRLHAPKSSPIIVDGTQAVGKIDLRGRDGGESEVRWSDAYVFSPHKFGGPRGLGVVLIRGDHLWKPLIPGSQQGGMRGGTIALPLIVAGEVALTESERDLSAKRDRSIESLKAVEKAILGLKFPGVKPSPREKGVKYSGLTLLLYIPFCSKVFTRELSKRGFDVGIGSACQTTTEEKWVDPAYRPPYQVRISISPGKTIDVMAFAEAFREAFMESYAQLLRIVSAERDRPPKSDRPKSDPSE